ncbi:FecCD family ABC transporter permease [Gordonia shandongensis]|uniref:FecCD family ABC transporter permease n=1 Tax=Gordonia shandongensis TaxID=376351 RepID=UPI0003F930CC|nr:iron chelate uptake ABC transporter family permease subunit [Gordonia shandongensis]
MSVIDAVRRTGGEATVDRTAMWRSTGLVVGVVAVAGLAVLSLWVGAKPIPFGTVWQALVGTDAAGDAIVVRDSRVPRTILAVLVGAALAVGGALIQSVTRNPLADPGLLGINSGAAFLVAVAVGLLGITSLHGYLWFAFAGAGIAAVVVYAVGSAGPSRGSPIRLTLAGVAVSALLTGVTTGLTLLDPDAFDEMRYWYAGAVAGRDMAVVTAVVPWIALGLVLVLVVSRTLNALALGDDTARALGASVVRTRAISTVAVTLLCGAATAAAGPISFAGLMVPHIARRMVGPDRPWIMAYSLVGGAALVLLADIVGRVAAPPGELPVGLLTAFFGAPVLIVLVRGAKAGGL